MCQPGNVSVRQYSQPQLTLTVTLTLTLTLTVTLTQVITWADQHTSRAHIDLASSTWLLSRDGEGRRCVQFVLNQVGVRVRFNPNPNPP